VGEKGYGLVETQPEVYEIIQYRPELRDQVVQLQTLMWSPDLKLNGAYLDWKYINNPYLNKPIIYLAMFKGQVVGMRSMFGMRWEGGQPGQTFCCLQGVDAVVHPDHRRRGLLEKMTAKTLADLADRGDCYIMSLSANHASTANLVKLGWRSVGELQPMQRPARPAHDSSVHAIVRRLPLVPSVYRRLRSAVRDQVRPPTGQNAPFEAFDRRCARARSGPFSHVHVEKAPRPEAMARLVDRLGHDGRLHPVRDQEFFAWRFKNPMSEYRFLFWEDAGLEGHLVLQMAAQPGEAAWCTIVDWEAANGLARAELLQAAIQWGNFDNLVVWSATVPEQIKNLLGECGFSLLSQGGTNPEDVFYPRLLLRPVRLESDPLHWRFADRSLLDLSSWDLQAICSDNF
jgi:GNAT superfamily N-acetyltransferase